MNKGQFIMVGAVILAGLIFGVVSITTTNTATSIDTSPQRFFDNVQEEFPTFTARSMEQSFDIDNVERESRIFMRYTEFAEQQRGLDSNHYMMVGLKTEDGYNVTIGNFFDTAIDGVRLDVGNTTEEIGTINSGTFYQTNISPSKNRFEVILDAKQTHSFYSDSNSFSLLHSSTESRDAVWRDTKINN